MDVKGGKLVEEYKGYEIWCRFLGYEVMRDGVSISGPVLTLEAAHIAVDIIERDFGFIQQSRGEALSERFDIPREDIFIYGHAYWIVDRGYDKKAIQEYLPIRHRAYFCKHPFWKGHIKGRE